MPLPNQAAPGPRHPAGEPGHVHHRCGLRWGFDSHSGFYRAFQKEYGMSPMAVLSEAIGCPDAERGCPDAERGCPDAERDAVSFFSPIMI